ncbi:hypothetical protein D3C86_1690780 [compost metagenome]
MRGLDIFRVVGDGNHVIEAAGAFFGDAVVDRDIVASFLGTGLGLDHIARVTDGYAEVAVGQVRDVLGRVEVSHRRAELHEQCLGFGELPGVLGVHRVAQVMQGQRQHLGRRIEDADAT